MVFSRIKRIIGERIRRRKELRRQRHTRRINLEFRQEERKTRQRNQRRNLERAKNAFRAKQIALSPGELDFLEHASALMLEETAEVIEDAKPEEALESWNACKDFLQRARMGEKPRPLGNTYSIKYSLAEYVKNALRETRALRRKKT